MSDFNFQEWSEKTRQIPQEHILGALQAVIDRKKALDDQPRIQAQAIETAHRYHTAVEPEKINGIPVWKAPPGEFAAYPPGAHVHHDNRTWTHMGTTVVMDAPGVDPAWVEHQEPEPGEVVGHDQL